MTDTTFRTSIFERDEQTCCFCGFVSKKYQEILPLNGDVRDTNPDNLATACIFCHQCHELEKVGEMRAGVLIWLPEIDQASLHHIARAIYIARIARGPMADAARSALDALMNRRDEAKKRLGTDDPLMLASALKDFLEEGEYVARRDKLAGIRLMPLDRRIIKEGDMEFNQFPQILAYWRSKEGPFNGIMPATWPQLFDSLNKTDGQA
ncbi:MAG: type IV secretion protein DotN [Pseudomonadota bacterium]|nr:type IV secretion protein DotN [Pseudomonadota bacterium]